MAEAVKLYSIESYEKVYNTFASKVVQTFNMEEEIQPQIYFVTLDDKDESHVGQSVQLDPDIVASMHTPEGQEAMWSLLTECVTDGSEARDIVMRHFGIAPDIVIHATACWVAPENDDDLPPSYSVDSNEILLVSIHTPLAVFLGSCPIDEDSGMAAVGPMDQSPCQLQWPTGGESNSALAPPSIH